MLGSTAIALGSLGSGLLSGLGSIFGSSSANSVNREIAAENRQWQSDENQINRDWQSDQNQINRDWQEKMWNAQNLYNSPSAMMSRLKDAGINPFVLGGSSGVATAGAAGSVGSPSAGSPSMVGAPSATTMMPVNYGAPIANALNNYLQVKGVEANAANQSAQSFKTLMEGATEAYKIGGHQAYRSYVHTAAPLLIGSNPDFGLIDRMATQQLRESVARTNAQEFQTSLAKEFGAKQAYQALMESEHRISEVVGRLNTMRVANDALIKRVANETLVAAAEAFNLRKQGNYYEVSKDQLEALKPYLVKAAKSQADLLTFGAGTEAIKFGAFEKNRAAYETGQSIGAGIDASIVARYIDYLTDQIGKVYHVSSSYSNSTVGFKTPPNGMIYNP